MLTETIEVCELVRIYGRLLTEKQNEVLREYFYENLSLEEIAEAHSISKQAVSDIIVRAKKQLYKYEDALGLLKKERK